MNWCRCEEKVRTNENERRGVEAHRRHEDKPAKLHSLAVGLTADDERSRTPLRRETVDPPDTVGRWGRRGRLDRQEREGTGEEEDGQQGKTGWEWRVPGSVRLADHTHASDVPLLAPLPCASPW